MTAKKIGRPSAYSEELAAKICEQIAEGLSIREITAVEEMPDQRTVYRWLLAHEDFRQQYTRAKEVQAERLADELVEIADDGSNDWMVRQRKDGSAEIVLNNEHVQRSRLRVDTRKWVAAKLLPKKYGEKVEMTGKDGKDLIPEPTSPEETARRLAYILTAGAAQAEKGK